MALGTTRLSIGPWTLREIHGLALGPAVAPKRMHDNRNTGQCIVALLAQKLRAALALTAAQCSWPWPSFA